MTDDTAAAPAAPGSAPAALPRHAPLCPLCGQPNACAPSASGRFDTACWCSDLSLPAALFEQLPAAARGSACICRACALAAGASPRATG